MTLFATLSDHAEASRQRHIPLSHDELKKERVAERSRARAAATAAATARGSVVVNHHHQKQQQELVIHASSYENARA
jgi:hypothetical protein